MTGNNSFLYQEVPTPNGFVHIYLHTMVPGKYEMTFLLSKQELERAAQYNDEAGRTRYMQAHVFVRQVLSSYLSVLPINIVLEYTPDGQPVLTKGVHTPQVHFSISYTGAQLMVGVSSHPVGVDIEQVRDVPNMNDLARDLFSSAERRYLQLIANPDEQQQYFFKVWTLKEAFIKGLGIGVGYGLQRFSALPGMGAADPVLQCKEKGWVLKQIALPAPYIGALAVGT